MKQFFLVTMPNRSVATPLSKKERDKIIIQKWEELGINNIFRENTVSRLKELYKKYELEYSFNGVTLSNSFGIKSNSAYKVMNKCIKLGIMRKEKRGVYYFNDVLN